VNENELRLNSAVGNRSNLDQFKRHNSPLSIF